MQRLNTSATLTSQARYEIGIRVRSARLTEGLSAAEAASRVGISTGAWMDVENGRKVFFVQLFAVVNYCWPGTGGRWVAIPGLPKEVARLHGPGYKTATLRQMKRKHLSVEYLADATGMDAGQVEFLLAQPNCKDSGIKELYHVAKNAPDPAHL